MAHHAAMYYVIDAVRWGADGHISHVKWHQVFAEGGALRHTDPETAPVVDAAHVCESAEVRVYVDGRPGRFLRMKGCAHGIDAEADGEGTPLRERMAHLPVF